MLEVEPIGGDAHLKPPSELINDVLKLGDCDGLPRTLEGGLQLID